MHVCYLQHLSELVEFFHKAHAGQDVLLSYPRVLRDDIWFSVTVVSCLSLGI
jgi:hypothetical protein